jgi:thioredoxin 1
VKLPTGRDSDTIRGNVSSPNSSQDLLMAVIELDGTNFEDTIRDNAFVVVDFWAPWCGPCRSFAPIYDKVSNDIEDVVFAKINTEEQQEIAGHFNIRSIPTLMIFREQIIVFSQPGALPESQFRDLLTKAGELDMVEVKRQVAEQAQARASGNA